MHQNTTIPLWRQWSVIVLLRQRSFLLLANMSGITNISGITSVFGITSMSGITTMSDITSMSGITSMSDSTKHYSSTPSKFEMQLFFRLINGNLYKQQQSHWSNKKCPSPVMTDFCLCQRQFFQRHFFSTQWGVLTTAFYGTLSVALFCVAHRRSASM